MQRQCPQEEIIGSNALGRLGASAFYFDFAQLRSDSADDACGNVIKRQIGVRGTTGTGPAGVLGQTFGGSSGGSPGPAVLGSSDVGVGVGGVSGSKSRSKNLLSWMNWL